MQDIETKKEWMYFDGLWEYFVDDIWTGMTIAKLYPYFGNPKQPVCFHVRDQRSNKDLVDLPILKAARDWCESYCLSKLC